MSEKMYPAAVEEDQDGIDDGSAGEPTVIGPSPFSSPDPATEGLQMLPLSDGTSAHNASLEAAVRRSQGQEASTSDYDSKSAKDLKALVEERGLEAEGNKKSDYVQALLADDAADMKASDFIAKINAATNQEELDAVGELYDAQDRTLVSVENAFNKKQDELNSEDQ